MKCPRLLALALVAALACGLSLVCAPASAAERCGPNVCTGNTRCCNDSCGICVPPGGACIQPHCGWQRDQAGGLNPMLDPRMPSPMAASRLALVGGWWPEHSGTNAARSLDITMAWAPNTWLSAQGGLHDRRGGGAAVSALWGGAFVSLPTLSPRVQATVGLRFAMSAVAKPTRAAGMPSPRLDAAEPAGHGPEAAFSVVWGQGLWGLSAAGVLGWNLADSWLRWSGSTTLEVQLPSYSVPLAMRVTGVAGSTERGSTVGGSVALAWHRKGLMLGVEVGAGRVDTWTHAAGPMANLFLQLR